MNLEEAINDCDWILTSTSWQSDHEKIAIRLAKKAKKKTISFLDHWVNYQERFILNQETVLPDELWVSDLYAADLVRQYFPSVRLKVVENPYLLSITAQINKCRQSKKLGTKNPSLYRVLYVTENLDEHAIRQFGDTRHWGYTEEEAFLFFIKNIGYLPFKVGEIKIRPHPSQSSEKYQWATHSSSLVKTIDSQEALLEDIMSYDVIVGLQSMAMVVGLLAGRIVISCIPPNGAKCGLPQKEILHLREMVPSRCLNASGL